VGGFYGVSIEPDWNLLGVIQSYVPFPHIITNRGNFSDSFTISVSAALPPGYTIQLYQDTNRNNIVDPGEPLTSNTGILDPGEEYYVIALVYVPLTAPVNDAIPFTVQAVSNNDPSPTPASDRANDTVTVVSGALIQVEKRVTPEGPVRKGDILEYEVIVSNIGRQRALSVIIRDPLPGGTAFIQNAPLTLRGNPVTDANDGDGGTLISNAVIFEIPLIAPDQQMPMTFKVQVLEDTTLEEIRNIAISNPTIVQVIQPDFTFVPNNTSTTTPGNTVFYSHRLTNTGNIRDRYDIYFESSLGYDVKIFIDRNGDGRLQANEPEVPDTDGDGILDTGFLEPGQSMNFIVKIVVPPEATLDDIDVTTVRAVSNEDPDLIKTVTDTTVVKPAIAGVIVDDITGLPVAGAIITVTNQQGEVIATVTTGEDGSYFVIVDEAGIYNIRITYTEENGEIFDHTVQAVVDENTSIAYPLCCISGTIRDEDTGEPIPGVTILLERTGDSPTSGTPEEIEIPVPGLETSQAVTVLPVTVVCDDRGTYVVCGLLSGLYTVSIQTAEGYDYVGVINTGDISTLGQVLINVDLELRQNAILRITKKVDLPSAQIGDIVTYLIEIENTDDVRTVLDVQVIDRLPFGFEYAEGTTLLNGLPSPDPAGQNPLIWDIGDIPAQTIYTIVYAVIVTPGAVIGISENTASVHGSTPNGTTTSAGPAKAGVQITESMFFRKRGVLIGKVYEDINGNGVQDEGEPGIAGVVLYLDDGTKVITGDDGKYSVPDVRAGTHALRLDETSLDPIYVPTIHENDYGDNPVLQFIYIPRAGLEKANFTVRKAVDIPQDEEE